MACSAVAPIMDYLSRRPLSKLEAGEIKDTPVYFVPVRSPPLPSAPTFERRSGCAHQLRLSVS